MSQTSIASLLDLVRYPIEQPGSAAFEALVAACRSRIERDALCLLPGFVVASALAPMARELDALLPLAARFEADRSAYADTSDGWPEDHPRSIRHACRYYQVMNYQIANDSLLRQIYNWQPLTDFLRRIMGYDTFFQSSCPHLALTAKIAGENDTDGWHFDPNDVVFSILLQGAEAGGAFEYVPWLRGENEENYAGVREVFRSPAQRGVQPQFDVGTLAVFRGDRSLHRVTPVRGRRRRIVALFCYDHEPGTVFPHSHIKALHSGMRQPGIPLD